MTSDVDNKTGTQGVCFNLTENFTKLRLMTTTHTQDHLARLWQESSRDLAVAFFRRAVRQDLNLAELLAALQFEQVGADLSTIRLCDILPTAASSSQPATARSPVQTQRLATKAKAARRRPHQTTQIKELLLDCIRKHPAGLKTPRLSEILLAQGFHVDTATANLILKSMEDEGQLIGDQGRPRLWRAKTVGRMVPEPVVIRRAPEQVAPPTPEPAMATVTQEEVKTHAALLSQAEVQAAAAALRDRFFAK